MKQFSATMAVLFFYLLIQACRAYSACRIHWLQFEERFNERFGWLLTNGNKSYRLGAPVCANHGFTRSEQRTTSLVDPSAERPLGAWGRFTLYDK